MDIIFSSSGQNKVAQSILTDKNLLESYRELADIQLVNFSLKGDEEAFEEIVRRHTPRVFSFASRFFSRRSLVEEAAQEVFLKAYTQLGNFENRGSFEGWLTRITVTTCINILRSAKRETELTVNAFNDEEIDWLEIQMADAATLRHHSDEEKMIAADLVNRVLDKMSAADRIVLTMIDGAGHSMRDVSQMTGWTESKVKIQAFRARRRMREAVEKLLKTSTRNINPRESEK